MNDETMFSVDMPGLSVSLERSLCIASLRHFGGAEGVVFGGDVSLQLPSPLRAVVSGPKGTAGVPGAAGVREMILAWRSPTETWLIAGAERMVGLESALSGQTQVSFVDQTGGIWIWKLVGERVAELLARLGAPSAMPGLGEARTGRLAELTALALCVRADEILLLVDRVYSAHLMGWLRETVADL